MAPVPTTDGRPKASSAVAAAADKIGMPCFGCGNSRPGLTFDRARSTGFGALSRAAAKYAKARWREAQQGQPVGPTAPGVRDRLAVCAACPNRLLVDGVPHCGLPAWARPLAGPADATPGCGCPIADKAADPDEHCPLRADVPPAAGCGCRWCAAGAGQAK